jgi:AmiR/NasT family two-component response regulator
VVSLSAPLLARPARDGNHHPDGDGRTPADLLERIAALETENEQLRTALESRIVIEQAKGAISACCAVAPETAFEMLRGLARSQRRNIHEYAASIIANGGRLNA